MTKTIWTGTFGTIIGIAVAAVAAQQPPTPPPSPPTPQSSSASSGPRVTVTGCLKEAPSSSADKAAAAGTAGAAGTTGAAGAAGAPTDTANADAKFVLTDAISSPAAAAPDPTAATSPAPAASPSTPPQTYKLVANPAALSPHVGKKLELTGTLGEQSALKVESGKVVAASCSQ